MMTPPIRGQYMELVLLAPDGTVLEKPWYSQNDSRIWNQMSFRSVALARTYGAGVLQRLQRWPGRHSRHVPGRCHPRRVLQRNHHRYHHNDASHAHPHRNRSTSVDVHAHSLPARLPAVPVWTATPTPYYITPTPWYWTPTPVSWTPTPWYWTPTPVFVTPTLVVLDRPPPLPTIPTAAAHNGHAVAEQLY